MNSRQGRAIVPGVRPGQRVGKYILGEQIAHGGMAEVWAAHAEGPGGFVKPLALKFIRESFAGDSELERLFLNEARLAARLQHANLVGVFDFDRVGEAEPDGAGRYYIAMERVDGQDLRRVTQAARHKGQPISTAVALYITAEVLKGLRYVHERRDDGGRALELVHRDVSPHNVLIGMDGDVKLSDFGIAKARTRTGNINTQAGTVRGKLAYASPEQLRGDPIDHRADQFALGVVLWELLADRRLFDGASEKEIADKVLGGQVPPLPGARGIDPGIEVVARRMLSARAAERFSATAEALNAVMRAPGYSPDARPLAELMHVLFSVQRRAVPPTVPMNLVASAHGAPDANPRVPAPTVEVDPAPLGDATGSSYVSDRSSALRARLPRSRGRWLVTMAGLAVAAIAAGVTVRRLTAPSVHAAGRPWTPATVAATAPVPPAPRAVVSRADSPRVAPEPEPALAPPAPVGATAPPPVPAKPATPAAVPAPSPAEASFPVPAAAVPSPTLVAAPSPPSPALAPPPVAASSQPSAPVRPHSSASVSVSSSAAPDAPSAGVGTSTPAAPRKVMPPNAAPILE